MPVGHTWGGSRGEDLISVGYKTQGELGLDEKAPKCMEWWTPQQGEPPGRCLRKACGWVCGTLVAPGIAGWGQVSGKVAPTKQQGKSRYLTL